MLGKIYGQVPSRSQFYFKTAILIIFLLKEGNGPKGTEYKQIHQKTTASLLSSFPEYPLHLVSTQVYTKLSCIHVALVILRLNFTL